MSEEVICNKQDKGKRPLDLSSGSCRGRGEGEGGHTPTLTDQAAGKENE